MKDPIATRLGSALRQLAATELLVTFPDAPATPLTADQLAAQMQLIALRFESGKVRLVFDVGELYYGNTVSVAFGASDPEIDG
jgi:hypothetical protein